MSSDPGSAAAAALAAELAYLAKVVQASQIYYAAVLAVTLYDWLLHLPEERKLIWNSKWTAGKIIYLLVRYIPCVPAAIIVTVGTYGNFSNSFCSKYVKVDALLAVLVTLACEAVLFLRTYSIWNKNKIMLAYLSLHFAATAAILLVNVAKFVDTVPFPTSGPCLPTGHGFFTSYWIAVLTFEVATTILITVKSVMLLKQTAGQSFLKHFARDGVFYGVLVVALDVLNIAFVLQSANPFIRGVNAPTATFLVSVACCHMMLALRRYGLADTMTAQGSGSLHQSAFQKSYGGNTPSLPIVLSHRRGPSNATSATAWDDPYASQEKFVLPGVRVDTEVAIRRSDAEM